MSIINSSCCPSFIFCHSNPLAHHPKPMESPLLLHMSLHHFLITTLFCAHTVFPQTVPSSAVLLSYHLLLISGEILLFFKIQFKYCFRSWQPCHSPPLKLTSPSSYSFHRTFQHCPVVFHLCFCLPQQNCDIIQGRYHGYSTEPGKYVVGTR